MAEEVMDKTKANFCGYFEATNEQSGENKQDSADDLRQAAEDLFK
jgi:hypothetical protein